MSPSAGYIASTLTRSETEGFKIATDGAYRSVEGGPRRALVFRRDSVSGERA